MASTFGSYKRVFMLGIDGMGSFCRQTPTPHMDRLFENGAVSYQVLASRPTISAQCWTSMLTGATPAVHQLTNSSMHPIPELPTIFRFVRNAYPDAPSAAFTDWRPIAQEIISPTGGADTLDTGHDDELVERLLDYLDAHDPKLLFVQFDSVDHAGHHYGYGTPDYLARITHVDGLLGRILDKYHQRGLDQDTLFIVSADHGGTPDGNHGGWTVGEREVFLGVAGKNVCKGAIGPACVRDYPAIVLWALGIEAPAFQPKGYAAQMPIGIFRDAGVTDRQPVHEPTKSFLSLPEPKPDAPDHITRFIPREKILLHLNFEQDAADVSGRCTVSPLRGIIKRYSGGIRGNYGEMGHGALRVDGLPAGDCFSFAFWTLPPREAGGWLDLFSNRGNAPRGFSLALFCEGAGICLKESDGHQSGRIIIGEDSDQVFEPEWGHFLFTVDLKAGQIRAHYNFGPAQTLNCPTLSDFFCMQPLFIGLDQQTPDTSRPVDDLLILDGAIDPRALERYYSACAREDK